ncbi:hypothetical protein Krac_4909 [Ktedonobacter racemifer DSM 44963]|uniref:Uncharacterized protein n=1 Tax=Ktedonobacter racemifer DSM 44963 TaxID=485913 RepID=D6TU04_KTERA|nr:hypothetical protein Krac_4909 [Ktedonobacter racemifer DSM 44963]
MIDQIAEIISGITAIISVAVVNRGTFAWRSGNASMAA